MNGKSPVDVFRYLWSSFHAYLSDSDLEQSSYLLLSLDYLVRGCPQGGHQEILRRKIKTPI